MFLQDIELVQCGGKDSQ